MREGGYDIIVLADIHRVLLRPKNASLFCNVRHLSWSLGSLAALAACSGGGGGGSPTASGGGRVAQPTFPSAVTDTFANSPDTSGYVVNFDSAKTWNGLSLAGQTVYARSGAMLQEDDATPTSVPADAVSYNLSALSGFNGGGGAAAMKAVIGGEVKAGINNLSDAFRAREAGSVKILGVADIKRNEDFLPDVPTLQEQGIDVDNSSVNFRGVMVPKGTPKAVIDKLAGSFPEIFKNGRVAKRMKAGGSPIHIMNRSEVQTMWKERQAYLKELLKGLK